jgi:hypothetical protein
MMLVLLVAVGVNSKSLYEGEEGEDSLHPDTFKRLAEALYQRGDKAENRYKTLLKIINIIIYCNLYYFKYANLKLNLVSPGQKIADSLKKI